MSSHHPDAITTPRPYKFVAAGLVFAGAVSVALGLLLFLSFTGNAKTADVQGVVRQVARLDQTNDCVRHVTSQYEQARDDVLLAIGNPGAFTRAQGELERLYRPQGPTGPTITRATAVAQRCPGAR